MKFYRIDGTTKTDTHDTCSLFDWVLFSTLMCLPNKISNWPFARNWSNSMTELTRIPQLYQPRLQSHKSRVLPVKIDHKSHLTPCREVQRGPYPPLGTDHFTDIWGSLVHKREPWVVTLHVLLLHFYVFLFRLRYSIILWQTLTHFRAANDSTYMLLNVLPFFFSENGRAWHRDGR